MELEEMKTAWNNMDKELQKQKILTNNLIVKMTQERYHNRFSMITIYESIASAICFGIAGYIIININKLDTWYFIASGCFTIILLIILPIFSLGLLRKLKSIDIKNNTYKESLVQFATRKERFFFFQKMTFYLNILLVLVILPLVSKLLHDKDIFGELRLWIWYVPILLIFSIFFYRKVYNSYKGITDHAGRILNEIGEN